jgi:FAD/FMN-containing dehydrogenase
LLEFEGRFDAIVDDAMNIFEHCVNQGWVMDGVMSQNETQAKNLWRLREDISETIAPFTPYKNDISVLITHVPAFIAEIDAIVADSYPDFEICWFGHIGDGNLHLNILKPANLSKDEFFEQCKGVNVKVFETVQKYDGSISAEHGVGMTKKDYLGYTRDAVEIDYLRAVKKVFDPNNVMNVGKIFDL